MFLRNVCRWGRRLTLCSVIVFGLFLMRESVCGSEEEPVTPKIIGVSVNGEKILPANIELFYKRKLNTYKRMRKEDVLTQELLQQFVVEARQQAVQKEFIRQYVVTHKLLATPEAIQEEERLLREQIVLVGLKFEDYLKDCNQSLDDFRNDLAPLAALTQSCFAVLDQDKLKVEFERVKKSIPSRRVSHVLFMHAKVQDTVQKVRTKEDAKRLADQTLAVIRSGVDFSEVASEKSDCSSKSKGGDLDWFVFETMTKPFSEAAFGLEKVGDVSAVVESSFGYHIIKLTGLRSEEECLKVFIRRKMESKLSEVLTQLAREAKVVLLKD